MTNDLMIREVVNTIDLPAIESIWSPTWKEVPQTQILKSNVPSVLTSLHKFLLHF